MRKMNDGRDENDADDDNVEANQDSLCESG